MYAIGDKVVITVSDSSPLEDFNGEVGIVREVTEDMLGHRLYDVEVDGNHILVFENETIPYKGEK